MTEPSKKTKHAAFFCPHCNHDHQKKQLRGYTGEAFRKCDKCKKTFVIKWARSLRIEVSKVEWKQQKVIQ